MGGIYYILFLVVYFFYIYFHFYRFFCICVFIYFFLLRNKNLFCCSFSFDTKIIGKVFQAARIGIVFCKKAKYRKKSEKETKIVGHQ